MVDMVEVNFGVHSRRMETIGEKTLILLHHNVRSTLVRKNVND